MNSCFENPRGFFSLSEERPKKPSLASGLSESVGDGPAMMQEIVGNEAGEWDSPRMAPDSLGRNGIRQAGRKPLERQSVRMLDGQFLRGVFVSLRWEDIDWKSGRMTVTSPKTEYQAGRAEGLAEAFS